MPLPSITHLLRTDNAWSGYLASNVRDNVRLNFLLLDGADRPTTTLFVGSTLVQYDVVA